MYTRRSNRIQRISQEIQRKISVIIQQKVHDPRIGVPTISGVQVSKDLRYAKVFITFLDKNSSEEINSAIAILQKASCFIRFLLARSVNFRIIPILSFKYDSSLMVGLRVGDLVSQLNKKNYI
ncbi:ribosome-binding factor A [Candidatus Blochmanniella vafra str. BVAF]|uniref:Ribosome-binding factor A n=1 Tax=Blochmanniella vafra (strain BVAF) TaxID=859654 RepID=E8Q6S2_BLOVB|nr:30S ribosome-binding factor RbfA [Candidatus Blochmannia vafer]ADV33513.1 ribosome-binding factor A [Candidatus Blochmannia vafer str. BVAF]